MNIHGKQSDLPFLCMQEQLQEGEKRGFFYAWVEKIFCRETRLDEVAHEQVA